MPHAESCCVQKIDVERRGKREDAVSHLCSQTVYTCPIKSGGDSHQMLQPIVISDSQALVVLQHTAVSVVMSPSLIHDASRA